MKVRFGLLGFYIHILHQEKANLFNISLIRKIQPEHCKKVQLFDQIFETVKN